MRGLSHTLPCLREGDQYAPIALGEDGVIYALDPEILDDVESFEAAVALGFDFDELREQYPCVSDWRFFSERPIRLVAVTNALTPRQRGMVAWSLITHHPGVDAVDLLRWVLEDVRLALIECHSATLARLGQHARDMERAVYWDREVLETAQVTQETRYLFECVQDLLEATTALCSKDDEHGGELKLTLPEIMRKMMVANIRRLMSVKLHKTQLGGLVPEMKMGLSKAKSIVLPEQLTRTLALIDEMGAWDVEFEVGP